MDNPVESVDNAASYLRDRISQVFDATTDERPKWTLTDARRLRCVLNALDSSPMQAANGEAAQTREGTGSR